MNTQVIAGPVVVGIDGSESAYTAVRWAARDARRRGAGLRLVHAFSWSDPEMVAELFSSCEYSDMRMALAREALAEAARLTSVEAPGLAVELEVVGGQPEPVLCAEAERARMLVLGTRGRSGLAGLMLGSVAAAVATRAVRPVVVVRGVQLEDDSSARPVVVGIDATHDSEIVLAFAFEAASVHAAPLIAVSTWRTVLPDSSVAPPTDWPFETTERKILARHLAGWGERYPDVPVEVVVSRSRPTQTLIDLSENAGLVVVAGRGRGPAPSAVSHALLLRATCPVAVVPGGKVHARAEGEGPSSGL